MFGRLNRVNSKKCRFLYLIGKLKHKYLNSTLFKSNEAKFGMKKES